ncbi:MAG: nickel-dependent hydrogenase large subunit [Desulfobacterales bacterium]|jgi:hydrogenase large subunit
MQTIRIMDPVTRIEGHLKVEITMDSVNGSNEVVDARCTGTLFRGFEELLKGRDTKDATVITQRICGVCPISHGQASVLALEAVSGWKAQGNARYLRNISLGANFVQSHILHFYLLAALDYVAGPNASPWTPAWNVDMRSGLAGISAHIADAVEARRRAHELGALVGGRMPTSHTFIPGGFSGGPNSSKISQAKAEVDWLLNFIRNTYLPDVQALAAAYDDYYGVGEGCGNLMAYGVFETDDQYQGRLLARGYKEKGGSVRSGLQTEDITESVTYSWYSDATEGLHPAQGDTEPQFPKGDAYSWLKAPRLLGEPFEAGPLARMTVNGDYANGVSVMDRHVARAREALKIASAMKSWLGQLDGGSVYDTAYRQQSGMGVGLTEAPRGALGHWVEVGGGRVANYQVITPTCWNASPRDGGSVPGPMEQALIGTPVADPDRPVEALRVIHSFDPCLSCAVHMMKPGKPPVVVHTGGGC